MDDQIILHKAGPTNRIVTIRHYLIAATREDNEGTSIFTAEANERGNGSSFRQFTVVKETALQIKAKAHNLCKSFHHTNMADKPWMCETCGEHTTEDPKKMCPSCEGTMCELCGVQPQWQAVGGAKMCRDCYDRMTRNKTCIACGARGSDEYLYPRGEDWICGNCQLSEQEGKLAFCNRCGKPVFGQPASLQLNAAGLCSDCDDSCTRCGLAPASKSTDLCQACTNDKQLFDTFQQLLTTAHTFTVEPGVGATYNHGRPTLYAHGMYEDSSVLAGKPKRIWLQDFADEQQARDWLKEWGFEEFVEFISHSTYIPTSQIVADLPEDDDY